MSNTVINTNVTALNSHRALTGVGNRQARSSERLSTGQRINRAADDAAGLAISEKMRAQVRGLDQATRNSQDGISLIQTAEGAAQEVQDIVQRIRELTVQAANDTLAEEDRTAVATEVNQLVSELEDIIERTSFNGISLLDGGRGPDGTTVSGGSPINGDGIVNIQNGAMNGQNLEVRLLDFSDNGTGSNLRVLLNQLSADADSTVGNVGGAMDHLQSHTASTALLTNIDNALADISNQRSNLGALQNRLEHTINNLQIASENTSASESRIRDTDMAREMMQLTQANVLQQAATSMLAQANQSPQGVLQLLN